MIGSDGEIPTFGKAAPHPRSYGTFARVLAVYVRERNTITLEDAVRKMTDSLLSVSASRPGIAPSGNESRRDRVRSCRVRDTATFDKPHQYAEGFSYVVVNGESSSTESDDIGPAGRVLYGRR